MSVFVCVCAHYLQRHTQKLWNLEFQHVVKPKATEEVEAVAWFTTPSPAHQRVISSTPGSAERRIHGNFRVTFPSSAGR